MQAVSWLGQLSQALGLLLALPQAEEAGRAVVFPDSRELKRTCTCRLTPVWWLSWTCVHAVGCGHGRMPEAHSHPFVCIYWCPFRPHGKPNVGAYVGMNARLR